MRLIDYNEIRKLFNEEYKKTAQLIRDGETHLDNLAEGFLEADRVIFRLPEVDAVAVVRCKDCDWGEWDDFELPDRYYCGWDGERWHDGEHFCSHGRRKESAE